MNYAIVLGLCSQRALQGAEGSDLCILGNDFVKSDVFEALGVRLEPQPSGVVNQGMVQYH